jgi:HlyD family secretion protein
MDVKINRLDPNVPDPIESRRRAAGRLVRFFYATIVFGVGFFIVYFGSPLVYLSGPGTVTSPRHVVSLPFTVQVNQMKLVPGATVKAGEEIAEVISPEQDSIVATYMRALADISGRTAELRIKARVAQESLGASRSYLRVTEEAAERIDAMATATVTFRMEVLRERASAQKAVVSQEAEVAESTVQLASLDDFIQQLRNRLGEVEAHFAHGRVVAPTSGIVSTGLADVGQSLVAGTPIAEILIRPISSWTGTFPMRVCSNRRSGAKSWCCSATATFPERSPKSCRFPVCTRGRSSCSCWRVTVLRRRSRASASIRTQRRRR